jgi:AcrR family transcriptional regulator
MPRNKTISDDEILAVARSHFLQAGVGASTRKIAKAVGISEAVIFQRFGTKEDLFFAAMTLPAAQLENFLKAQAGEQSVVENLETASLQIMDYFREVMPVFLSLITHPSFSISAFLLKHRIPAAQLREQLLDYLTAEAKLGRVRSDQLMIAVEVLLSHLHTIALHETIGEPPKTDRAVTEVVALLWAALAP